MNAKLCILGTRGEIKIKVPRIESLREAGMAYWDIFAFGAKKFPQKMKNVGTFLLKSGRMTKRKQNELREICDWDFYSGIYFKYPKNLFLSG